MTEKELKWHKTFIKIALEIANHSTCCRKQVACLLVKNNVIISTGYNGTPSGQKHCNEYFTPSMISRPDFMEKHRIFSNRYEVHSEQNAIAQAAKNEVNPEGATAYVTLSPCLSCAKLLITAGIKKVFYYEKYDRDTSGIDLLKEANIQVERITLKE